MYPHIPNVLVDYRHGEASSTDAVFNKAFGPLSTLNLWLTCGLQESLPPSESSECHRMAFLLVAHGAIGLAELCSAVEDQLSGFGS